MRFFCSLFITICHGSFCLMPCQAESPNLLIIQTDEHNFRTLGCYRNTLSPRQAYVWGKDAYVETPAIDAIATRGAICTSFYATSPVCTPSRASFFSGRYPQNTNSWQNNRPLSNDVVTFAEVLRRNGYATGYAGKWHLDGAGKPQWAPKRQFGFEDNRFMFNRGHWKHLELTEDGPRVASRNRGGQPSYALDGANEKTFATDWLSDRAIDFIRKHSSEPFCFHLSLPDPHGPNTVREPYDTKFIDTPIRAPVTFAQSNENPKWAPVGKNSPRKFSAIQMAHYFGMVACIDDNVAKITSVLDELGLTQNTIVVFTSDHGDLCYEHGRLNKGIPYEASAKIPMIVAAPGKIPPGTRVDQALGTVDFAPTMLSLLGFESPKATEGRDASRLFRGQDQSSWDDIAFLRSASVGPSWVTAVTDRYKLVISMQDEPWFFDFVKDPNERLNQFDVVENRPIIMRLAKALLQYGIKSNDSHLTEGKLREQLEKITDN